MPAEPSLSPAQRTAIHTNRCRSIRRYLDEIGAWYNKNLGALGVRPGLPDFFVCVKGRFVGIEVKTGEGKLRDSQKKIRDEMLPAGAIYIEAHGVEDVEDVLAAAGLVTKQRLF